MQNIIPQNDTNREEWLLCLSEVVTDPKELFTLLDLDINLIDEKCYRAKQHFSLRVPKDFISRMEKGNYNDPLLRQVMLHAEELRDVSGFDEDPLKEKTHNIIPNLLHKYINRALLITKNSCAINCRYCFRRHFPYQANKSSQRHWLQAIEYIKIHHELDEIILSGGDPLMAKDHEIQWLLTQLASIPHIKRVRFHTRLAIVIPSRITQQLCEYFRRSKLQIILVTHINHANEIDEHVHHKMQLLRNNNVTLLNQSVLLQGVNDNKEALIKLSYKLFDAGILPYYLHLLDHVKGAAHFLVSDEKAKQLMRELSAHISGYLVPKLAREISGEKSKTLINYF